MDRRCRLKKATKKATTRLQKAATELQKATTHLQKAVKKHVFGFFGFRCFLDFSGVLWIF